jgi:hypothetical protein
MGLGPLANQIYIVDFELEKRYRDGTTHEHIPRVEGKPLAGTARYASVGVLKSFEQSRRDHVEVLGYAWIYPLPGALPWMDCRGRDERQKHAPICESTNQALFEPLSCGFPRVR